MNILLSFCVHMKKNEGSLNPACRSSGEHPIISAKIKHFGEDPFTNGNYENQTTGTLKLMFTSYACASGQGIECFGKVTSAKIQPFGEKLHSSRKESYDSTD